MDCQKFMLSFKNLSVTNFFPDEWCSALGHFLEPCHYISMNLRNWDNCLQLGRVFLFSCSMGLFFFFVSSTLNQWFLNYSNVMHPESLFQNSMGSWWNFLLFLIIFVSFFLLYNFTHNLFYIIKVSCKKVLNL